MNKKEKFSYIIVTAIITAIITWIICNDNYSLDRTYLKDLQEEIDKKNEEIKELQTSKDSQYEEKLNSIESYLDEISIYVDEIYEQTVPQNRKTEIENRYKITE